MSNKEETLSLPEEISNLRTRVKKLKRRNFAFANMIYNHVDMTQLTEEELKVWEISFNLIERE